MQSNAIEGNREWRTEPKADGRHVVTPEQWHAGGRQPGDGEEWCGGGEDGAGDCEAEHRWERRAKRTCAQAARERRGECSRKRPEAGGSEHGGGGEHAEDASLESADEANVDAGEHRAEAREEVGAVLGAMYGSVLLVVLFLDIIIHDGTEGKTERRSHN